MTSIVHYLGDLRTKGTHIASSKTLVTDAPIDNHGMGEAFSPTDTVATGLASCLLTLMGIKAKALKIDLKGTYAEVVKVMASEPRRISEIKVDVYFPQALDDKTKLILERAALTCPVAQSLHPDLKQDICFHWPA
jgi:putative redox protein